MANIQDTPTVQPHPLLRSTALVAGAGGVPGAKGAALITPPPVADQLPGWLAPLPMRNLDGARDAHVFSLDVAPGADMSALSPEQPITITGAMALGANETALIVGFDEPSGMYLPLGTGRAASGGAAITIDTMPDQGQIGPAGKSVGGMMTMLAYKIGAAKLGVDNPYPLLRSATVAGDGSVLYAEDGVGPLRARVQAAQRIALLVHGFTGDSRGMLQAMPLLQRQAVKPAPYDLLLAFDYENMNTRIQDSAALLKDRLAAIGLGPAHGKIMHLVAHSLGTQVSRWFVEREGGAAQVQRVVLLGPPNNGTPLVALRQWLSYLVGLGLNGLLTAVAPWTVLTWAVRGLSAVAAGAQKIDTTLDQLKPDSEFYRDMNRSVDPEIPYHVIIGDTHLVKPRLADPDDMRATLFQRVFNEQTRNRLFSLAFAGRPNDLAISLGSAQTILEFNPPRAPLPVATVVASDHISYFADRSPGLAALAAALADT